MTNLVDLYRMGSFIDTFALGHYARVVEAVDHRTGQTVAFKVLRVDHLRADGEPCWEYRAFGNEAQLLNELADSPHVIDLLGCGYISSRSEAPTNGRIISFDRDVQKFMEALPDYAKLEWRPYLTLPLLPRSQNLFYLMKPSQPGVRWRWPTEEGLALALQFAHTLQFAHRRGIVYLDHKLEHIYWDGVRLEIIDLNSSRQLDSHGVGDNHYFRMDIHNLCVGVLYPLFTGLSPQKTTLRPQPGNRSEVETRYQDVTTLDFGVEPTLSRALQKLLQRGAALEIETVDEFLAQLQEVASRHGWDFPDYYTGPASREARDHLRAGLNKLRDGQASLREARDLFRDAAILEDITEDLEEELRRLVKEVGDMLNQRVIP